MANCPKCGAAGHGIRGHLLERRCEVCVSRGCDRCTQLEYITDTWPVTGGFSGTEYGKGQLGACSPACYETLWETEINAEPYLINELPYIPLFSPQVFEGHVYKMIKSTKLPTAGHIEVLGHYHDRPLAQGITIMYTGFKDLDHGKITDGLRLCRNDPTYERMAKEWVDNVAHTYVADLKRLDVPTSRTTVGGVQIAITMPRQQNKMKLHQCPSCGAQMDTVAFRGQVVRCSFCSSTFEIT
jgi:hypothetical protein